MLLLLKVIIKQKNKLRYLSDHKPAGTAVDLITELGRELGAGRVRTADTPDRGVGSQTDGVLLSEPHISPPRQSGMQFTTHELFP